MSQASNGAPGSAAAIWTPKRVFVAASGCAILRADGAAFAMTGLTCCDETSFDAAAIAAEALQGKNSLESRVRDFMTAAEEPLQKAAQHYFDTRKEEFKKNFSGRDTLGAIFFCEEYGGASLVLAAFATKMQGKNIVFKPRLQPYPHSGAAHIELVTAGIAAAAEKAFKTNMTSQQALVHPEETLKSLMEQAAECVYPIHLMKVSAGVAESSVIEAP